MAADLLGGDLTRARCREWGSEPWGIPLKETTLRMVAKSISHHEMKPWLKPLLVGIYRGIMIPEFLRWCRISSLHSREWFSHSLPIAPAS